ncbi:MAG TPA: hypothetical protein VHN11_06155, partial [Xanthobacteraceae bacterium]|nr:hypothetical protein [Xanthobacteraceae bacterium]
MAAYFMLANSKLIVFDTDANEPKLKAHFIDQTHVIDLNRVSDQMQLFDTLAAPGLGTRVVDVTHQAYRQFFRVMRETDFVSEARAQDVDPVIFYVTDRQADGFEQGVQLRD